MSKMADQIAEALKAFERCETQPALIGGLALAAHHYVRATQDIDFLVASEDADRLHEALIDLGYRCVHRSEDAANYLRGGEGLDFLYAHRPVSRALLIAAPTRDTLFGRVRVVSAEGLIGFKLQALVNNLKRTRDLDNIRQLLRNNRGALKMGEVRQIRFLDANRYSMNSSPKSTDSDTPFATDGGIAYEPRHADPFAKFFELMEVIEALCPVWPEREHRIEGVFLL